jgi:DNA-binding CsgD family transcriptional regulator
VSRPGRDPVVGREDELETLAAAFRRAAAGAAGAVLLVGEAGIGKSRLVEELRRTVESEPDPVLVLRGAGTPTRRPLPYLPFVDVLAAAAAADLDPGPERDLRDLLDAAGPDRLGLFRTVLAALRSLAGRGPLVLVLEDLHWADQDSLDLLLLLLGRLRTDPVLVLATTRTEHRSRRPELRRFLAEAGPLPHVERLDLAPLDPDRTLELVRALPGGGDHPPAELARVVRRSDGNPYLARQLLAAGPGGALAGELADVLADRLEDLSGPVRQVLQAAAVVGRPAPTRWLCTLSGLPDADLAAAVREALDAEVLVVEPAAAPGEGRLVFRQSLLRDFVYHDLLPDERTRLHAALAELLADGPDAKDRAADLAHHALAAQDLPLALSASVRASREAARRGALQQVLAHGEQALDLWPNVLGADTVAGASEVLVTRLAAMGAGDSGRPEQALALLERAVGLAGAQPGPELAAATLVRYALRLLELPGRERDAADRARDVLGLLADRPAGADRAWGHAVLARALHRLDRGDDAADEARAAVAAARAAGSESALAAGADPYGEECDALGAEADGRLTLAFTGLRAGSPDAAGQFAAAKEPGRLSGHYGVELRAHHGAGLARLLRGDLRAAADEMAAGADRAAATGTTWSEYGVRLRVGQALALFRLGRWADADRVLGTAAPTGSPVVADQVAAVRAVLTAARSGRSPGTVPLQPAAPAVVLLAAQARAESALWQGRPRQAAEAAATALALVRTVPAGGLDEAGRPDEELALAALGATAYADLAAGGDLSTEDAEAGAALLARARDRVAGAAPNIPARAWLTWVEAEHRRMSGADDPERWADVAAAFGFGDPYRIALARWRQVEALLAARSAGAGRSANQALRSEAARRLAEATELATATGAAPLLAATGELAVRAGIRSADAAGPGHPLTARERSVLELVAQGLTNRQIGLQLFISEKTASVHVSRIMAKLDAESRAEAVSVAHRRRLLG